MPIAVERQNKPASPNNILDIILSYFNKANIKENKQAKTPIIAITNTIFLPLLIQKYLIILKLRFTKLNIVIIADTKVQRLYK